MTSKDIEFELNKIGLGYIIDPNVRTEQNFNTGDSLVKFTGRILEHRIAEKEILISPPTLLEFLLQKPRRIRLNVTDVLTDLPMITKLCERHYKATIVYEDTSPELI